jgi:hypothetical protein
MSRAIYLLSAIGCALWLSGCAHAQARATPEGGPALEMPAPPTRDVEAIDTEVPPPLLLPGEPAHRANTTPARRASPPVQPPKVEVKPEPPKVEPPPAVETKPEEAPKAAPPTMLQTTPAGAEGEMERLIRATLGRATTDLSHIDYRVLNAEARTQYDTAKNFIRQAESAIGTKNLNFARTLADKAAGLAAQLAVK